MLVYPADVIMQIREASRLGITSDIRRVDFPAIMARMRDKVEKGRSHIQSAVKNTPGLDYFEEEAQFVDEFVLRVGEERIRGQKIFIAAGARPLVPDIEGLQGVPYLTNASVLQLRSLPESLAIIGGGDIAVEYAHFFSAMGTEVTLFQRNSRLVPAEDVEVSDALRTDLAKRMRVYTGTEVTHVRQEGSNYEITGTDTGSNDLVHARVSSVFLAAGRRSNADLLRVDAAGVRTDDSGYITVDDYFETSRKGIWAFGDILGKHMFRHVANRQAVITWQNSMLGKKIRMDFHSIPHAVFTYPQIASVGFTEQEARRTFPQDPLLVGRAGYPDVAMGEAMGEHNGFAKAIVHGKSGRILGFHICGPASSILIQEVVNVMAFGADAWSLGSALHIHPALPELIIATLNNLREAD